MNEFNINEVSDSDLEEMMIKAVESKQRQQEANKRWREKNKEKIRTYHQRYNNKRKALLEEAKKRGLTQ